MTLEFATLFGLLQCCAEPAADSASRNGSVAGDGNGEREASRAAGRPSGEGRRDALCGAHRTVQVVVVPPHAPLQPAKIAPVVGVATRETVPFWANVAEQTVAPLPQLIAPVPPVTLAVAARPAPSEAQRSRRSRSPSDRRPSSTCRWARSLCKSRCRSSPRRHTPRFGVAVSVTVVPAGDRLSTGRRSCAIRAPTLDRTAPRDSHGQELRRARRRPRRTHGTGIGQLDRASGIGPAARAAPAVEHEPCVRRLDDSQRRAGHHCRRAGRSGRSAVDASSEDIPCRCPDSCRHRPSPRGLR